MSLSAECIFHSCLHIAVNLEFWNIINLGQTLTTASWGFEEFDHITKLFTCTYNPFKVHPSVNCWNDLPALINPDNLIYPWITASTNVWCVFLKNCASWGPVICSGQGRGKSKQYFICLFLLDLYLQLMVVLSALLPSCMQNPKAY